MIVTSMPRPSEPSTVTPVISSTMLNLDDLAAFLSASSMIGASRCPIEGHVIRATAAGPLLRTSMNEAVVKGRQD